jgi:hypothetical protein
VPTTKPELTADLRAAATSNEIIDALVAVGVEAARRSLRGRLAAVASWALLSGEVRDGDAPSRA